MALALPESHRTSLAAYLRDCAGIAPRLRWVPPENLHLTLRFVGRTSPDLLARLREGLAEVPLGPFEVALGAPGSFGRGARARVCWLGVSEGREPLRELAGGVEALCRKLGLEAEVRPYSPHLTLARSPVREGVELPSLPPPPALPGWRVEEFGLYQSQLGAQAPVYSRLETFSI